jgi:aminoglycoside phosphotransferase (APT) family kinase protein
VVAEPGCWDNLLVRKADITADLVSRLVASQFPRWAGLPVKPVEAGGWDSATFRLGQQMLVRLPAFTAHVIGEIMADHLADR